MTYSTSLTEVEETMDIRFLTSRIKGVFYEEEKRFTIEDPVTHDKRRVRIPPKARFLLDRDHNLLNTKQVVIRNCSGMSPLAIMQDIELKTIRSIDAGKQAGIPQLYQARKIPLDTVKYVNKKEFNGYSVFTVMKLLDKSYKAVTNMCKREGGQITDQDTIVYQKR